MSETESTIDEASDEKLWRVLGDALGYTLNETILLSRLEDFMSPSPASLAYSKEESKALDNKVDTLQKMLGGVPRIIIQHEDDPLPTYDCYAEAALREMVSLFHRCRRSVARTHMHFIGLGLSNRCEDFLEIPEDKELKESIESTIEERFWEHAETSYIRLASYWDRVGQLLDFVFFNIRQYERDGFASVMQRIRANYAKIDPTLADSRAWLDLWSYQKSEQIDGFAWLVRRRNLLIHSLHLRPLEKEVEDEPLFNSEYNHLDESTRQRLIPQAPQEELQALHRQLSQAAVLFRSVIALAESGANLNTRVERGFL